MGAASSTPASGLGGYITRTDMLKSTEQPRILVDRLFTFFADNLAQKDILALANPTRCSEYIFVMSDALDRLFYQLRLEPGLDKKGVLYFRKSADITKTNATSADSAQRKYLCLSLAFFYIRIFQIYAALALSVNDSASYGLGFGASAFAVPRAGPAVAAAAPGLEAYLASGGSTTSDIKRFSILRAYISSDPTRAKGTFTFDKHPNMILRTGVGEKQNLSMTKASASEEGPNTITCDFYIRVSGLKAERRLLTFINFKTGQPLYDEKLVKHGPFGLYVNQVGENYESESGERVDDLIYRVMSSAKEVSLGKRPAQKGIPRGGPAAAAAASGHTVGEAFVPEGLRTQFFMTQLRKIPKPLAHCVARSLQLLNIDALASPKIPTEVKTSICKVKFETAQGGIPDIGKEITSAPGLAVLNELFFDKISSGKPAIGDETIGSYQAFVKSLAESFGENPSSPAIYMSSVINKADKLCETGKKDKTLTVRSVPAIQTAQAAVQMLWKSQIEHDKKVLEILTKLVVVQTVAGSGVKVSLNPLILKTGNPGVAIVAKEARELLTKYYSNCEKIYRIAAQTLGATGAVSAL